MGASALGAEPPSTPGWVVPLGIACIVYASLGILMGVCGVGVQLAMPWFFDRIASLPGNTPIDSDELGEAMRLPLIFGIVMTVFGAALGVVLIVGGVRLAKRRRSAVPVLKAWCIGRLILVAVGLTGGLAMVERSVELSLSTQGPNAPFSEEMIRMQAIGWAIFGAVAVSLAPVVLLIFLTRRRTRETIAAFDE